MLMNYIDLLEGKPRRMHFSDKYIIEREVWDTILNKLKTVKSLTFWVDELEGEPVAKTFSVLSARLSTSLEPYLADGSYKNYDFVITKRGDGFAAHFSVEAIPRTEIPPARVGPR